MGDCLQGLVLGVLLLLVAAGCQPLIFRHFGHSFVAKRLVAVTAAAGVLLVLLRPPMPVKVRPPAAQLAMWNQGKVSPARQQAIWSNGWSCCFLKCLQQAEQSEPGVVNICCSMCCCLA